MVKKETQRESQEKKYHNEALMPMTLGSPFRVPHYAYSNWGLVYGSEEQADAAYKAEWEAGNAGQLGLVSKATIEAGFGDFPDLLRKETAKIVASLLQNRPADQPITILDIGAGPGSSALEIYKSLPDRFKLVTTIILLDPSAGALKTGEELMKQNEIKYKIVNGSDSDELPKMKKSSVDIVTGIASVHHHAKIPFDLYKNVLKIGGSAVFADWHQSIWEHPGSVYEFLKRFDWPKKEKGLKNFLEIYPEAKNAPPSPKSPEDRKAIEQITQFWLAYKRISDAANLGPNAIWPHEGHRPVKRYVEEMKNTGFSMDTLDTRRVMMRNPYQILPGSSLLQLTVGQKLLKI